MSSLCGYIGAYHLLYFEFHELQSPFEVRHFHYLRFTIRQLHLDLAHLPHRRGDVDEEHGDCVLQLD